MSVSASIKICKIIVSLHRWAEKCIDNTIKPELEIRISREVKRCLDIYESRHKEDESNLEMLNLLLCVNQLVDTPIPRAQILGAFNLNDCYDGRKYEQLDYFQICSLLYLIGRNRLYEDIRVNIVNEVNRRLLADHALLRADNAMLFFDMVVCPYVDKKELKQIVMKVYNCSETKYGNKYKELTLTRRWFFNWKKEIALPEVLSKKEYHSPYE